MVLNSNCTQGAFLWGELCWVFVAERGFSLVAESRDYSPVSVGGRLIAVASLVAERGLESGWASVVLVHGLSSCGAQA